MHVLAAVQPAAAGSTAGSVIAVLFGVLVGLAFYLVPTIVAWIRHVPNAGSVTVLNVFLGWTLVGWVVALMMACRSKYQAVMTPYQQAPGFQPPMPPPGFVPPQPSPRMPQAPLHARDDTPPGYH